MRSLVYQAASDRLDLRLSEAIRVRRVAEPHAGPATSVRRASGLPPDAA